MTLDLADVAAGCLLGGACGDALGAPIEFYRSLQEIRGRFGPAGITEFSPAYGRLGAITDDTQMTLWTAEGLLRAGIAGLAGDMNAVTVQVYEAYLRWLMTQGERSPDPRFPAVTRVAGNGWLIRVKDLHSNRGPGLTCVGSLRSGKMGTMEHPLNNSKGCGGIMRAAPVGLAYRDPAAAFDLGCRTAAITHSHPSGYFSAGALAAMVACLAGGMPLPAAVDRSLDLLAAAPGSDECLAAARRAVALAARGDPSVEKVEMLGEGWTGEEALAIAVYCALCHPGNYRAGVVLAVNHRGDSDSTGAICGNLLGAAQGRAAIPASWLEHLELRDEIADVAAALADPQPTNEAWARHWTA